ncbi:hypothetical protein EAE32_00810 [Kocuria tytonicola]|uniref:ABC transporter substrate-binding protein n=1 Tax=Kocuria tytonicola TaxID=2055946 RepID=A0A3L9L960_9MICC|nr:hypothetical protein EAE32_00810 [Kocuria tytonicola]
MFRDRLAKNAPWIELDYRGGPEVMAPNLLIEGVASGAFDGASMPGDYYTDQVPAMQIARFTPFTPMQERANGVAALYETIHQEQLGVHYVGRTVSGMPQVLLLKEPLTTTDLSGRAIRTSSATSGVVRAMGGIPVDLPGGEVYTALERSVVSGAAWASVGPSSLGLQNVASYYLAPRFFESLANLVINGDIWRALDDRSRKAITDTMTEVEPEIFEHFVTTAEKETAEWRAAGMKENALPERESRKLLEIAYRDVWKNDLDWERIERTSPASVELRRALDAAITGDLEDAVPGVAKDRARKIQQGDI